MVATVDSFEIRKFSNKLEDDKDWIHYPHRSDLLINFVLDENQARISITWRTQTLERFSFFWNLQSSISIIAKYPCVGYKQKDTQGFVTSRFQVGFHNRSTYDDFVLFLRQKLKLAVEDKSAVNSGSQSTNGYAPTSQNWLLKSSQTDLKHSNWQIQYGNLYNQELKTSHQPVLNQGIGVVTRAQTFAIPIPKASVPVVPQKIPVKRNHTYTFNNHHHNNIDIEPCYSSSLVSDQFGNSKNVIDDNQAKTFEQEENQHSWNEDIVYGAQSYYSQNLNSGQYHLNEAQLPPNLFQKQNTSDIAPPVISQMNMMTQKDRNTLVNKGLVEPSAGFETQSANIRSTPKAIPEKGNFVENKQHTPENLTLDNSGNPMSILSFISMDAETQRAFIIKTLKDPKFIELVKRVEEILQETE